MHVCHSFILSFFLSFFISSINETLMCSYDFYCFCVVLLYLYITALDLSYRSIAITCMAYYMTFWTRRSTVRSGAGENCPLDSGIGSKWSDWIGNTSHLLSTRTSGDWNFILAGCKEGFDKELTPCVAVRETACC